MTASPRKGRPARSARRSSGSPAAAPRKRARRRAAAPKTGRSKRAPIRPGQGREVTGSFWAEAWCKNLAAYSELAHRLPRGMELVHEGAVVDLQIGAGRATALVRGSDTYKVIVTVAPLAAHRWSAITAGCAGGVASVADVLRGWMSEDAMDVATRRDAGILPGPAEIAFDCSCPDPGKMCEHIAAVLFGIGVRIAGAPDLLFALRRVDPSDMVTADAEDGAERSELIGVRVLEGVNLSELFGIQIDDGSPGSEPAESRGRRRRSRSRSRSRSGARPRRRPASAAAATGEAAQADPEKKAPAKRRRRRRGGRKPAEATTDAAPAKPARSRRRRRRPPKKE